LFLEIFCVWSEMGWRFFRNRILSLVVLLGLLLVMEMWNNSWTGSLGVFCITCDVVYGSHWACFACSLNMLNYFRVSQRVASILNFDCFTVSVGSRDVAHDSCLNGSVGYWSTSAPDMSLEGELSGLSGGVLHGAVHDLFLWDVFCAETLHFHQKSNFFNLCPPVRNGGRDRKKSKIPIFNPYDGAPFGDYWEFWFQFFYFSLYPSVYIERLLTAAQFLFNYHHVL